jgi:hypothetical protein
MSNASPIFPGMFLSLYLSKMSQFFNAGTRSLDVQVPLQMVLAAYLPRVGEVIHLQARNEPNFCFLSAKCYPLERKKLLPRDLRSAPRPQHVPP